MTIENSQDYYGRVLESSADLRTDACCTLETPSTAFRAALANVHPAVKARYYGCGLVAPQSIAGTRILDLGSGSGQDAYVLAQMVGAGGEVVGVDATPQQLAVAEEHRAWHAGRFGFANVSFLEGDIARLGDLPLADASFDVVVSNCVINLVADKAAVFRAAHRLLKLGGEMYFSDVYADRRLPAGWRDDPRAARANASRERCTGATSWRPPRRLVFRIPASLTTVPSPSPIQRSPPRWRASPSSRQRGVCSSWRGSTPNARTTGRRCAFAGTPSPASLAKAPTPSHSTSTT